MTRDADVERGASDEHAPDEPAPDEPAPEGHALNINRRDALKALSVLPAAVALGALPQQGTPPKPVTPHATPSTPAHPGPGPAPRAGRGASHFFTPHELATVRLLADYVIPRDERSGSATDAKVPEYMDFLLAERDASEDARVAMRGGLAWMDAECRRRFGKTFVRSADAERRVLLDDIAWPAKARAAMSHGVVFFNRFRDMTASGFFSSAVGWKDLRYMGHVFVPEWQGCPSEALRKLGVSYDLMKTRVGTGR